MSTDLCWVYTQRALLDEVGGAASGVGHGWRWDTGLDGPCSDPVW